MHAQPAEAVGCAYKPEPSLLPAPCSPAQMEQMCDLLIERVHALEKEEGALRCG